jgi:hypothetical protein
MTRAKGITRPCTKADAQQRLKDAHEFLEAAELMEYPDVIATNAIHAAVAATDALTCLVLGSRSADGNHRAAVEVLNDIDPKLGNCLRRALVFKTSAGYESTDVGSADASSCIRWAKQLIQAAEQRLSS